MIKLYHDIGDVYTQMNIQNMLIMAYMKTSEIFLLMPFCFMMKRDCFKQKLLLWPQVSFNVRINDTKVVITFVAIVFLGKLSSDFFTAFISSKFGIFLYKDFTSDQLNYLVLLLLPLVYL